MTLLAPLGLFGLVLAVPIIVVHMLAPRRPPTPVSSLLHWDGLKHSITATQPWQKLRWSLLFILQLLAVILFALALARPAEIQVADLASHTVFMVDASGSMSSIDGSPDRLGAAVERAQQLRKEIPSGGAASIIAVSTTPIVLLEESDDERAFDRAIEAIRTTAGTADFEGAFALAESLVSDERPTGFILLSDGHLRDVDQRLAPLGTWFEPIGEDDTNRAITDLSVSAGPAGLLARITVESTGGPDATQVLRVDVDGITVDRREVVIPSGQVIEETFELPLGSEVAAYLDGEDLISYDNQRYAAASVPGTIKVRINGDSSFFVEQLLSSIPNVDLDVAPGEEVDLEVYASVPIPPQPTVPFLAIDTPGGAPGLTPSGRIEDPIPTLLSGDAVLEDVDVSQIAIADAQVLSVASGQVLLAAPGAPLLIRSETSGVPFFYIAFTLEQSNLPVNVAFPILGSRIVRELTASEGSAPSLTVGQRVPIGADGGEVTDPRRTKQKVGPNEVEPVAELAGFWVMQRPDADPIVFAVNADPLESDAEPIRHLPELRPAVQVDSVQPETTLVAETVVTWVIWAILVVLAIEIVVSYRKRGVSDHQFRWGVAIRAAIVALLAAALIDPAVNIASESVTTVFVVDSSASLGSSVDEARAWVGAAIIDAGDSQWAVVEVGDDARVATPVGRIDYAGGVGVDAAATNLGRGLRLAESLLTGASRERIVVVSDGRSNAGDLPAEVERLKRLGVVVDVHTIAGQIRSDAAVAAIDVPARVNEGEAFVVTVDVLSAVAVAVAEVELLVEDVLVGVRTVGLEPGSNPVTFDVDAGQPGLEHLTARVRVPGDAVGTNDETTTAVEVRGPAGVLLVEGTPGDGETLTDALISKGLVVKSIGMADLPAVQELAVHQAVILVDVSARDMSERQVEALDSFVSDLGRGLVVVGGDNSYALGGYRNSPLEALLPVDSDAQDTQREASVAEVLLIDTSESMGACHCAEEDSMESVEGGVNKTDISKAAAIRAVDALGANDEIGVLVFSGSAQWVVPLQQLPSSEVIESAVGGLRPAGETRIIPALRDAADELRASKKELKHIILFTDGFTTELNLEGFEGDPSRELGSLVEEVAALAKEGITISVVGTGEGAISELEKVAQAGNGRFYAGRDLNEIPEIFVKEARLAARSFINEGEFFPSVTSTAEAVRGLASSPALLGFVATTPKPTADVQLQVGEFGDPLLASWRVGLGKATTWTSDGGAKWASQWAAWDGYQDFWSNVVRDTFPLGGSEGQRVRASIAGEEMTVTLESAEAWPAGTSPVARVGYPDGTSVEMRLDRKSDFEFEGRVSTRQGGAYAVGVGVPNEDGAPVTLSAIASRSFAAEYLPGVPDAELLTSVSIATGGRGEISSREAFDAEMLPNGRSLVGYRWLFLLLAALLFPIDVALRRLRFSRRAKSSLPPPLPAPPPTPTRPVVA